MTVTHLSIKCLEKVVNTGTSVKMETLGYIIGDVKANKDKFLLSFQVELSDYKAYEATVCNKFLSVAENVMSSGEIKGR